MNCDAHCHGWLEVDGVSGLVADIPRLYWNCHYSARMGYFGPLCPACFYMLPKYEREHVERKRHGSSTIPRRHIPRNKS